jgi:hypothetical protein
MTMCLGCDMAAHDGPASRVEGWRRRTRTVSILRTLCLLWRGVSAQSGGMWYSMICFDVNPGICR